MDESIFDIVIWNLIDMTNPCTRDIGRRREIGIWWL